MFGVDRLLHLVHRSSSSLVILEFLCHGHFSYDFCTCEWRKRLQMQLKLNANMWRRHTYPCEWNSSSRNRIGMVFYRNVSTCAASGTTASSIPFCKFHKHISHPSACPCADPSGPSVCNGSDTVHRRTVSHLSTRKSINLHESLAFARQFLSILYIYMFTSVQYQIRRTAEFLITVWTFDSFAGM